MKTVGGDKTPSKNVGPEKFGVDKFRVVAKRERVCPHCRSYAGLSSFRVVVISLDRWPLMLLSAAIVIANAVWMGFSPLLSTLFTAVAVLPLAFTFLRKSCCEFCDMEFRDEDSDSEIES